MTQERNFHKWEASDFANLTPIKVRELITQCFYESQHETFRRIKKKIGLPSEDQDVFSGVVSVIRLAFTTVGADYDNPTKDGLQKVIQYLAQQAVRWGTPKEVIEHNDQQIKQLLDKL